MLQTCNTSWQFNDRHLKAVAEAVTHILGDSDEIPGDLRALTIGIQASVSIVGLVTAARGLVDVWKALQSVNVSQRAFL